jgi:aryl-alcohol dehydrogenase-like predicted oxidoreductase
MDSVVNEGNRTQRPELALGTVQWGLPYGIANRSGQPTVDEVREILAVASAAGIATLDTARAYGSSESTIGALVGDSNTWRVMTKVDPDVWSEGRGVRETAELAEASLRRSRSTLRRECLDAVLLHRASHRLAAGGAVWSVLRRQREAGRVRAIGVSVSSPDEAMACLEDDTVEVLQVPCSLLDQRLDRLGFLDDARRTNRLVVVRSVFLQGVAFLQPAFLPRHLALLEQPLKRIDEWSRDRGVPRPAAFLAYALHLESRFLLVGCETSKQLRGILELMGDAVGLVESIGEIASVVADLEDEVVNPAEWGRLAFPNAILP